MRRSGGGAERWQHAFAGPIMETDEGKARVEIEDALGGDPNFACWKAPRKIRYKPPALAGCLPACCHAE